MPDLVTIGETMAAFCPNEGGKLRLEAMECECGRPEPKVILP